MNFENNEREGLYRQCISLVETYEGPDGAKARGGIIRNGIFIPLFYRTIQDRVPYVDALRNQRKGNPDEILSAFQGIIGGGIKKGYLISRDHNGIFIVNEGNISKRKGETPKQVHLFVSASDMPSGGVVEQFVTPKGVLLSHLVLFTFELEGYTMIDTGLEGGDYLGVV
ncbi:MAG: hypothetical protein UT34_C0001G0513 [candidate division WS6 bacterium GW2011_GWF2_39_15]|uniref:Uncharacterized protein n=1 Tax=candidate division WS6 bacterium GW2011_GWF2_39_15 TaxID=1619100 RepID=A0A0G0QXU8_9BACT|nr:MAG: hypothetical protein UT34_C0001G0513 [candidate division WS6 bacterium GW2011_GWF2_39_15]